MGPLGLSCCPIMSAIMRQTAHKARSSRSETHGNCPLLAGVRLSQNDSEQRFCSVRMPESQTLQLHQHAHPLQIGLLGVQAIVFLTNSLTERDSATVWHAT